MTRFALSLLLVGALAATAEAGRPAHIQQIRDALTQYRADAATLKADAKAAAKALLDSSQTLLQLDEAGLDMLEDQLEEAYEKAEEAFELLDEADQTEAKLKELIVAEMKLVFPNFTQDAAQQATLEGYAQTFADAIAPLRTAMATLKADTRAKLKDIRDQARAARKAP